MGFKVNSPEDASFEDFGRNFSAIFDKVANSFENISIDFREFLQQKSRFIKVNQFLKKYAASSLDQIKMTKRWLEFDRKI